MNNGRMIRTLVCVALVLALISPTTLLQKNYASEASMANKISLNTDDWQLQSSAVDTSTGTQISSRNFTPATWYKVSVPGTVMSGLVESEYWGKDFDPFYGMNLTTIQTSLFSNPWWYRKEFTIPLSENGKEISLDFKGINYRAELWINGQMIKTSTEFVGTFREWQIDITDYVVCDGVTKNVVALKIFKPFSNDLAFTFVNWSPAAPDANMGIWNEVYLTMSGSVKIHSPMVSSKVDTDLKKAHLKTYAELSNFTGNAVTGTLYGKITGPNGDFSLTPIPVTLNAGEINKRVAFNEYDVSDPKLWWPRNYGPATLNDLELNFVAGNKTTDTLKHSFGIREVATEYLNSSNRKFFINGKQILLRGAAPCPDMFQRRSSTRTKYILDYVKDMNLNILRYEGKLEDEELMDLCDKNGILVAHGWCCCDEWQNPKRWDAAKTQVAYESLRSQIKRLEIHPSIFIWMNGSDIYPDLRAVYEQYIKIEQELQWPNIIMSSAINADVPDTWYGSEDAGCKMLGPYQWEPPIYWFEDHDIYNGARDVNFETCSGPAFPEPENMKKFIPENKLWPANNDNWVLHSTTSSTGRKTLINFKAAIDNRYGAGKDFYDYNMKAQISAYEANRSEMEAFGRNKYTLANAQIHWMMNNSWPTLEYQIFDYYFGTNGTYYGIKKALEPLHIQYAYDNRKIDVVNSTLKTYSDYKADIAVYNFDGKKVYSKAVTDIDIVSDDMKNIAQLPIIDNLSSTYFLRLTLKNSQGATVSTNSYALSTTEDTLDWAQVEGMHGFKSIVPQKIYGNLKSLQNLPKANLKTTVQVSQKGEEEYADITITNFSSSIAYGTTLKIAKGEGGEQVLPLRLTDNYFMLLPNETRKIRATYYKSEMDGKTPVVVTDCFNNVSGGNEIKSWDGVNLAFGKSVQTSSANPDYPAANANDRNQASCWKSETATYPQWCKIDLGKEYDLGSVVSNWNNSEGANFLYKVEVSSDDSVYTKVAEQTQAVTGTKRDAFSAKGRYVKITVMSSSNLTKPAAAYEFEVYGPAPAFAANPTVYNTTYNSQGGSKVINKYAIAGTTLAKPSNPSRKGYRFAGWYTASSGGSLIAFPYKVTKNATLYAHWVKIPSIPQNLKARHLSSTKIKITWSKSTAAYGYMVYRAKSPYGTYKLISMTRYLSFTDKNFVKGKTQYYKVKSYTNMRKTKVFSGWSKIAKT